MKWTVGSAPNRPSPTTGGMWWAQEREADHWTGPDSPRINEGLNPLLSPAGGWGGLEMSVFALRMLWKQPHLTQGKKEEGDGSDGKCYVPGPHFTPHTFFLIYPHSHPSSWELWPSICTVMGGTSPLSHEPCRLPLTQPPESLHGHSADANILENISRIYFWQPPCCAPQWWQCESMLRAQTVLPLVLVKFLGWSTHCHASVPPVVNGKQEFQGAQIPASCQTENQLRLGCCPPWRPPDLRPRHQHPEPGVWPKAPRKFHEVTKEKSACLVRNSFFSAKRKPRLFY